VELAGSAAKLEHDVVQVLGAAEIEGGLEVHLASGNPGRFEPRAGDEFTIFTAEGGIDGRFSHVLLPSPDWGIQYDDTSIRLVVLDPAGRGDYNGDSRIDQADLDLVLSSWGGGVTHDQRLSPAWTHYLPISPIDQSHLDAVLSGWGRLLESGTAVSAQIVDQAVPEPSTTSLVVLSVSLAMYSMGQTRRSTRLPH
jgi:hypothetical protein